ncbi:apolipoprotein N-acyltransferase [Cellulomonas humilata]|uniref:Apolipoprotein N-acyltransferase n=1 Tax=Cellulomonas humilata TaxID=144055 RepID=A0A7Y5ZZQ0_9CELL|nr:apolipoprotein N-acyltransferase [Cellulomonas humilata]NUU17000.1 apolipoprotein N-acyltransferase [Cellulomonas humilata]
MPRTVGQAPRAWSALLAVAAGPLTEAAFPGRSWWPMAFVGIALFFLALRRDSAWWGFVVGLLYGLGFFLPHVWWANEAVGQPIGWVALSLFQAFYLGVFGAAWVWVRRGAWVRERDWRQVVAVTVLWIAVEQLRGRWPFGGFPWGSLAFSQTGSPLLRLAAVGGEPLVSGAVVATGAVLAVVVLRLWTRRVGEAGLRLGAALAAVLLPGLVPLSTVAESGTLWVGAVQGNVPSQGAEAMSQAREVAANHADGTRALLEQVDPSELDLVLWPESASDIDPRTDEAVAATVDAAARAVDAPILLGTQRFLPGLRYNNYILWKPGAGADPGVEYTKQRPVPFGEFVPYRELFRQVAPVVDRITTDMVAGTRAALVEVGIERLGRQVPITTAICFEVAYDDLIREGVLGGGELIVIPTNNASFGLTPESTQQLAMSRFRAVEHGRAVAQVSTVGVSALIAPDGDVLVSTSLFTAEQMVAELPLRTSITPADWLGEWPGILVDVIGVVLVFAGLAASRKEPTHAGVRRCQ